MPDQHFLLFGRIAARGRVRAVGHPGAPPPAPGGRKRRKPHRSKEGQKSQTTASPEKTCQSFRARVSRKRRERQSARVLGCRGAPSRSSSGGGHGGYGSDDSYHTAIRTFASPEAGRTPYPVHPASASYVVTSPNSPGWNRPEMAGVVARREVASTDLRSICQAEGDFAKQKEGVSRTHGGGDHVKSSDIIGGAKNQMDAEEGEESSHRSSMESGQKRRASLLRVRRGGSLKSSLYSFEIAGYGPQFQD